MTIYCYSLPGGFEVAMGKGANMGELLMKKDPITQICPPPSPPPPILHFYVHKKCTIYPKLKRRHLFPSYSRRQDNIVHEMRTIVSHLRRNNIVHFGKWTIFGGSTKYYL